MRKTKLKRGFYIFLGTFCLVLGTIGLVVPILPTTPFWLLTCWCYFRGSRTLYRKVMRNRYFGNYVKGFLVDRTIPLRAKICSIALIWVSCIGTALFLDVIIWVKLLLLVISIGVTIHILSYPTKRC